MIPLLRNVRIERKLMLIIMLSCMFALVVAGAVESAFQLHSSRKTFIRDLTTLSKVIASNTTGAVAFKDAKAAGEVLEALRAKPSVRSASIWLPDGSALCQFGVPERLAKAEVLMTAPFLREDGFSVMHFQPIVLDGEQIGMLYLRSDLGPDLLYTWKVELCTFGAVTAVTMLLAFLISKKLQAAISGPIRKLADMASDIAVRKDYSVRAKKFDADEVGSFTDAFNHMLDEIERQDAALRHEIEERVRAEQKVDQLHKQVLATSRQAGMAEVATGVLHNVGNVLNSVNISTALLSDQIRKSRIQNVARLGDLLRSRSDDLGEFVTNDPKGRALPGYITELGQRLDSERTRMLGEIDTLGANIEHIKEIVAMQQNYAKVHGVTETLPLVELVEDALRMNAAAFVRHGVTLERNFADIPPVSVDKHKVLQVLTNLLRNAKYAVDEVPVEPKIVRVSIRTDPEGFALVIIRDNGVGIPKENLTRIFGHGFTTRRDGHGFGLHSGANAATEMGGRLTVESEGEGAGATFTLALPLAKTAFLLHQETVCQNLELLPTGAY